MNPAILSDLSKATKAQLIALRDTLRRAVRDDRIRGRPSRMRAASKKNGHRTPDEWRELVMAITDAKTRARVASIVWWDQFGDRPANDPWRHLDDIRAKEGEADDADPAKVQVELVRLGYSESAAEARASLASRDEGGVKPNAPQEILIRRRRKKLSSAWEFCECPEGWNTGRVET